MYLKTLANFFCTSNYKFHVEGCGLKGNTVCIYRHSEAGRRENSRKHTQGGNRLPGCIVGAVCMDLSEMEGNGHQMAKKLSMKMFVTFATIFFQSRRVEQNLLRL